jgi:nucleoside-triphosphatase
MKNVCLLTGPPRVGKTTLIKQAVGKFQGKACGFYTEEIHENNERQGFRLVTLDGQKVVLSRTDLKSPYRVGKYGVNIEGLEKVGVTSLLVGESDCDLVVVDEIGKMEMLSLKFRDAIERLIAGNRQMLGTVLFHHHTWADIVKARPEVQVIVLNRNNYAQVFDEVKRWLQEIK